MKINVAVFFGGRSVEHEVSVISAVQAMNAIDKAKYDVTPVYITKQGEMYHSGDMTDIDSFKDIPGLLKAATPVTMVKMGERCRLVALKKGVFRRALCAVDIAFPIVHGTNCEDGSVVGWFELLGLPYVGCDVLSAAVGMDKAVFKTLLNSAGISVLPGVDFYSKEWTVGKQEITAKIEERFSYPLIVKPANLGSSVGVSLAADRDGLNRAVKEALVYAQKILVEPAVTNLRELNCSVAGDVYTAQTSLIEEPVSSGEFLSYADKYTGGKSGKSGKSSAAPSGVKGAGMSSLAREVPARISEKIKSEVESAALAAFRAIGGCGVVRIDFLYDTAAEVVYVNEVNTIPGSLSFYLWQGAGVDYTELLCRLIDLGFARERTRQNLAFSFDTNILSNAEFGGKNKK